MTEIRRPLGPQTPPEVAHLLNREFPSVVDYLEGRGQAFAMAGNRHLGEKFMNFAAEVRESSRTWQEYRAALAAAHGRTEVPRARAGATSVVSSFTSGLTTREVAEQLQISPRQVTNLVRVGRLVGHRRGGVWVIDEVSVTAELERRRDADEGAGQADQ